MTRRTHVAPTTRRAALAALACLTLLLCDRTASAQSCDDANLCTINDMCAAGVCRGSFEPGAGCDDRNPCTVNDICFVDPIQGPLCRGTPTVGLPCSGGCGTCQAIIGSPNLVTCGGSAASNGMPCEPDLGPCLVGSCLIVRSVANCLPRVKECADTDGNPCTDSCDFQTGECAVDAPKCVPTCETCNVSNGLCEPANLGGACDDGNVCTSQTRCQFNDDAQRTFCLVSEPGESTATPTEIGPTPTGTPGDGETATPSATVDAATPTDTPTSDGSTPTETTTPGDAPPTDTPTEAGATPSETGTPTEAATTPTDSPTEPGTTPTSTPIGGADTPTVTPTGAAGTPTVSPTAPDATATLPPAACIGDCNDDGLVVVNELVTGVNIALERAPIGQCPSFDGNDSGAIEVNELISGVSALIGGCG